MCVSARVWRTTDETDPESGTKLARAGQCGAGTDRTRRDAATRHAAVLARVLLQQDDKKNDLAGFFLSHPRSPAVHV